MIVRDGLFVNAEVFCISLTILVTLTVFLCCLISRNFALRDHNAAIACGLSLLGTLTLFLVLSETNSRIVCVPLISTVVSSLQRAHECLCYPLTEITATTFRCQK